MYVEKSYRKYRAITKICGAGTKICGASTVINFFNTNIRSTVSNDQQKIILDERVV